MRQYQQKFVATVTRHQVDIANDVQYPASDSRKDTIANVMTVGITGSLASKKTGRF